MNMQLTRKRPSLSYQCCQIMFHSPLSITVVSCGHHYTYWNFSATRKYWGMMMLRYWCFDFRHQFMEIILSFPINAQRKATVRWSSQSQHCNVRVFERESSLHDNDVSDAQSLMQSMRWINFEKNRWRKYEANLQNKPASTEAIIISVNSAWHG